MLLLLGSENTGKTVIMKHFYSKLDEERYIDGTIYLTRKSTCKGLNSEIRQNLVKKTSVKIGQNLGLKINI